MRLQEHDIVKMLLSIVSDEDEIYDIPAEDGTTALQVAIGTGNAGKFETIDKHPDQTRTPSEQVCSLC